MRLPIKILDVRCDWQLLITHGNTLIVFFFGVKRPMTSEERVCKLLHVRYRKLGNGCRFYICASVMCWKIFVASLYYALIWAGFNYHSICKVNNPNFQIIYKSTYTNVESVHFHLSISNNNTHKHKYHGNMLAFIYPVASKGRERVCVCVQWSDNESGMVWSMPTSTTICVCDKK